MIVFGSEFGCTGGVCRNPLPNQVPRTASTDITINYLTGYGHLDVYAGTHSLQDVKEPALEWMNDRR